MAKRYLQRNIALLANQTLVLVFLVMAAKAGVGQGGATVAVFVMITALLALAAYSGLSNLKGSRVLFSFSLLLVLAGWFFLLSVGKSPIFGLLLEILLPVLTCYMVIFLLGFIFQDAAYPYKRVIALILLCCALLPILLKPFGDNYYALALLGQYVLSVFCCVFVFISQRERVGFFLRTEWQNILPSSGVFCAVMALYIAVFHSEPSYLENSGMFLIICLPLWSVFKVAYQAREPLLNNLPLKSGQILMLVVLAAAALCILTAAFSLPEIFLLLVAHIFLWFVILFALFMVWNRIEGRERSDREEAGYLSALVQLEKEEELKKQFSDFLHDEILQDVLAMKNLMSKADRQEVRELITNTLEGLNKTVREEMQDYRSVMLADLTLKDNYQNLLDELAQKYRTSPLNVEFVCARDLFLVVPYHLVIYRAMRELVTNAYKHSQCTSIEVRLAQEEGLIELTVKDDGEGRAEELRRAMAQHRGNGLVSLQEQVAALGGQLDIRDNTPQGIGIYLSLEMKGGGSYQYFAHR